MDKEIKKCPYCNEEIVIKIRANKTYILLRKPRFKNGAEAIKFRKWAEQQGYVYAKDTEQELILLEMFRMTTKSD